MNKDEKRRSIDRENKKAPHVNPSRSGVRSGNPQLDPDSVRREDERPRTPKIPPHARREP